MIEEYQLRPLGWENDPEEERLRFSSLDYLAACTYNSYAIFFKLDDEERPKAVATLREGLEHTLAQCRQLVGNIEKNPDNDDHSFVKKRDTSVKFVVKYFDNGDNVPSMAELEKAHFTSLSLGDTSRFIIDGMAYGEKSECHPNANPILSAYQANFIPGGLIFITNFHHYANDIMGWANFVRQLADNCAAIFNHNPFPPWDPANLDATRFTAIDFPSASKVDGPTPPDRHPLLKTHSSLLFHLPKSKAAELKSLASPKPSSNPNTWISTYDAFTALLIRVLTALRAPLYTDLPSATTTPLLGEAVNMRPRTRPLVAPRHQRNLFWAALSSAHPPALTVSEITAGSPSLNPYDDDSEGKAAMRKLASKIRAMTNTMDQSALDAALAMLAPVRDKTGLFTRVNSFPPLTVAMTDWREAKVCQEGDFGFGKPCAWRHLFGGVVTEGLVVVYPPRIRTDVVGDGRDGEGDEGCEFVVAVENEIVERVIGEEEGLGRWMECRGWEVDNRGK